MDLVFDQITTAENDSAKTSTVPINMFGGRIDDAIGPMLKGLLRNRRRENIVDDETGAMFMRDPRDRREI